MKQRFFLLVLAFTILLTAVGFTIREDAADPVLQSAGNIFSRTVRRFNDARRFSDMEYELAHQSVLQVPEKVGNSIQKKVKDAASDTVEKALK